MEISLESIQEVEDPYQAFVDSIKNSGTFSRYRNNLHRFLKLIPNQVCLDTLNKIPEDDSIEEFSKLFVELGQKNLKIIQNIIAAFIKEDRKKVDEGKMSNGTKRIHTKT